MYAQLSTKLSVTTALSPDFSMAVPMNGANAYQVDLTIFAVVAAATLSIEVQGSNDIQNWFSILGPVTALTVGFSALATMKGTGVAFNYIRLKMSSVGAGGAVILAAGINTAQL